MCDVLAAEVSSEVSISPPPPLDYGGHDCEFVDELPEHLMCIVCRAAFKEPHLLSCCGRKICYSCITLVKNAGLPCPHCREQNFLTMFDKDFDRQVLSLKVYCCNKYLECDWIGELRHMEHHLGECRYVEVACAWNCGQNVIRNKLREHEEDECLFRPSELKLKRSVDKMQEQIDSFKEFHKQQRNEINQLKEEMVRVTEQHEVEKKQLEQCLEKQKEEIKLFVMERNKERMADIDGVKQLNTEQQKKLNEFSQQVKKDLDQVRQNLTGLREEQKKGLKQLKQESNEDQQKIFRQVADIDKRVEPVLIELKKLKTSFGEMGEKTFGEKMGDLNKKIDGIEATIKQDYASKISVRPLQENFEKIRRYCGLKVPEWQQPLPVAALTNISPCQFTMHHYSLHKSEERTWYSPPFFNEPGGYKFCLRVDSHGMLEGKSTHLSVWVYVMKGLHDEALKWPFGGKVTVQLLNWNADQRHVQNIIAFDDQAGSKVRQRVTTGEVAPTGRGSSKFVSRDMLTSGSAGKNTEFIKDDCLCFRIYKIDIS